MKRTRIRYDLTDIPPDMARAWKIAQTVIVRKFLRDSNRSDVEDFGQLAWVAVLKVWRRGYRADSLRRIATNQAVEEWVHTYGRRSKWLGTTTADDMRATVLAPVPAEPAEPADLYGQFWRHLSPAQQAVLEAVVIDGMDHAGAAAKLGLTPSTVRTVVCRAKQRLRVMAS